MTFAVNSGPAQSSFAVQASRLLVTHIVTLNEYVAQDLGGGVGQ